MQGIKQHLVCFSLFVIFFCILYYITYLLQGDSGGPLTVEVDGTHTLVGIVSRKLDLSNSVCDSSGHDIYTNVLAFLSWITKTIKEIGGMASCGFKITAPPSIGKLIPIR